MIIDLSVETAKSKLLPLCRTRWVERLNAFEVTLDLFLFVIDTLTDMLESTCKQWNRDTVTHESALLKRFDFEFLINRVRSYTGFGLYQLNHYQTSVRKVRQCESL